MKAKKMLRCVLPFVMAALMLGIVPAYAADANAQADYNLYVYAGAAEQGDILTISAGDEVYTYAVSTKAVRGLDISDSRSYAGDFTAVAGVEGMMLTVTDPDCSAIAMEGNWKDSLSADNVTVTFNGEEQSFDGDSLQLECAFGTLLVGKDGSVEFNADAASSLVTVSQSVGEKSCSVSLQRLSRELPKDSTAKVVLKESKMDGSWTGVPLPTGMAADPDSLSWNQYVQFSIANGGLFCRQDKPVSSSIGALKNTFTLYQTGSLTASGNWSKDLRNDKRVIRFNGAGHAFGTPDVVTDGIFALHLDRWYYTADDQGAGAFQFTSQQRGLELVAAVGRGETPKAAAAGGEVLSIEGNEKSYTHTMQRLSSEEGKQPLTSQLTTYTYIVP